MMSTWQSNGQMCSIVAVFVVISLLVLSDGAELSKYHKYMLKVLAALVCDLSSAVNLCV